MKPSKPRISPATLDFLKDLERHNHRDWFLKHKERYQAAHINVATFIDALKKGETGDRVAIFGAAASGGTMAIGTVLLLAARSIKRKQYGAPSSSGSGMTDKRKRNLTLGGTLLVLYGLIFVGAGAVLARNDDDKKAKNGKILLGIGGAMSALGLLLFIPLLTNKFKKSANVNVGPMWVRGGTGAGMRMRF